MNNKRGSWGSNIGFMMAAVGSAVGLGNIWGFPYKMGKSGGFTFLIAYLCLAVAVGFVILLSELALGRRFGYGAFGAYNQLKNSRFKWIRWLAVLSPFLILSFYSVLGGHCIQYLSLNLAELSFGLQNHYGIILEGSTTFGAMLTKPLGCVVFTLMFLTLCYLINRSDVAKGIEKFNKIGMPALFFMLVIFIVRTLTMEGAVEGLKFMFVPGYAVEAGFISETPGFISVLGTAGGQMFFSLSLAMGIMITYGSYVHKEENLKKSSIIIVVSDTIVALMAGVAVIPAAVALAIASGMEYSEISLSGPKLLFVTLQDVFSDMGTLGPLFGVIFYMLVLLAAISSSISLIEVLIAFFLDSAHEKGHQSNRSKVAFWVCVVVMLEATLVAACGMGSNGIAPANLFSWTETGIYAQWNDCWLDFMDFISEGVAMPLGAMLMALMIGWELKPDFMLDEVNNGKEGGKFFNGFYTVCIKFIVPIVMASILAGMLKENLTPYNGGYSVTTICYVIAIAALIIGFIVAVKNGKKIEDSEK